VNKKNNETLKKIQAYTVQEKLSLEIPVAELVGKTGGLYFCACSRSPCIGCMTAEIAKVYKEIKKKGEAFEIFFISHEEDQDSFKNHNESMPWLDIPFGDKTSLHLDRFLVLETGP